jgi:2-C-methyl-D-erythritol 2,4-cyclodiphosphate synthase
MRIGIGYDVHRLVRERPLRLGGVTVPSDVGLLGHSDADVVLHALTDALLGAVGAPDIGDLFSDRDPQWKDADSRVFLAAALDRVRAAGCAVGNVDVIIHAQVPRLGPHKEHIRTALAELLGVSAGQVGIKATTNEGLDAIGRGEAIGCWAAVLLERT